MQRGKAVHETVRPLYQLILPRSLTNSSFNLELGEGNEDGHESDVSRLEGVLKWRGLGTRFAALYF